MTADTDLLGKTANDLQSDVSISGFSVTGTLKYITGYTGFSSDVKEQSGNFLALKIIPDPEDVDASFRVLNGVHTEYKAMDKSDWTIVVRITDTAKQKLEVKCVKDGETQLYQYSLAGLKLDPSA